MEERSQQHIYADCARQIHLIERIKCGDKTVSDVVTVNGIPCLSLVNPVFAYYYLPLLQSKKEPARSLYKGLFWTNSFLHRLMDNGSRKPDSGSGMKVPENRKLVHFLNFSAKHYSQIFKPVTELDEYRSMFSTISVGLQDHGGEVPHMNLYRYYSEDKVKDMRKTAPHPSLLDPFRKAALAEVSPRDPAYKIRRDYFNLAKRFVATQLPGYLPYIQMGGDAIDDKTPDLMTGGDFCDPRCIVMFLIARARGIPTLVIQQGLVTKVCSDFCFPVTDKVAVWNKDTMENIREMGAPVDRFRITGNPGYDKYQNGVKPEESKEKIVLFISQPAHKHGLPKDKISRMKRSILASLEGLPGHKLVVKPHPDEEKSWYETQIKRLDVKNVLLLDPSENTSDWIRKSHFMIGFYSTALMEGMAAGRPVIVFDEKGDYNRFASYEKEGAAYGAAEGESIRRFLTGYAKDDRLRKTLEEGRKRYLDRHMGKRDGKASERVLDIILELTGGK